MGNEYFEKYSNSYGGIIKDLNTLPPEVSVFMVNCQESIKSDIDFVSNFEEVYNFRPEFTVGFLKTIKKTAFTCTDDTHTKCFIGISLGLVLSLHDIIYEALSSKSGFLDSYFGDTFHPIDKLKSTKIKRTTFNPIDMENLLYRFCAYHNNPLQEDEQLILNGIVFTAISFICKHEMAHFFRSHSTLVYRKSKVEYFDEEFSNVYFCFNSETDSEKQFMRALESDADAQASIMMAREIELEITDDFTTEHINEEDILNNFYEVGLSIGILFLCLDNRDNFNIHRSRSHPPSIIRFANALYVIRKYMEVVWKCDKDRILREHMDIIMEIENLAILLGYPDGEWIRFDEPKNSKYLELHNIMNFMNQDYPIETKIFKEIDHNAKYDFTSLTLL